MIKLFGALLVFSAFFAGGAVKASALKNELFTLRGMIQLTELMKNEIVARRTRLQSLAEMLLAASDKYTADFAESLCAGLRKLGEKSFADIWRESIDGGLGALSKECRMLLAELGGSIGRYDVELQQAAFERCIYRLCEHERALSGSYSSNRKMYFGVFGGTGLIALILLM